MGNRELEIGNWEAESRNQKGESGKEKAESRKRKAERRKRKSKSFNLWALSFKPDPVIPKPALQQLREISGILFLLPLQFLHPVPFILQFPGKYLFPVIRLVTALPELFKQLIIKFAAVSSLF